MTAALNSTGRHLRARNLSHIPDCGHPFVTVVIPCYNYGQYLADCVNSVATQAGVELEIIIVDDASADNSLSVANAMRNADSRIRIIAHAANRGHISTYNEGLGEAKGEYVVLLSADDMLAPGHLQRAVRLLEHRGTIGFVYGPVIPFMDVPPFATTARERFKVWRGSAWLARRCRRVSNCVFSPEVVMRRSVYERVGPYRSDLPHNGDLAMWLLSAGVSDVGYIEGPPAAYYRKHAGNMHRTVFRGGQVDGMMVDLRQRRHAFAVVFEQLGEDLPGSQLLRSTAMRQLAAESLAAACRAYTWGLAEEWPCTDLVSFAQETWPDYELLPQWRALTRRQRFGVRRSEKFPPFVAKEVAIKVGYARKRRTEARFGA